MTRFVVERPQDDIAREARTPVRLPDRNGGAIFAGWGPKL